MSFVGEPYLADIFISYSHGDVESEGDSNFKRWSRSFYRELRRELRDHPDLTGVRIFFDDSNRQSEGVQPFVPFGESLEEHATKAAIFLPLISPHYLNSRWCLQELEWWRSAQEKHQRDTRGRLAPIYIWGLPPSGSARWPDAVEKIRLAHLTGIEFYSRDNVRERPQPFGWPGSDEPIADRKFIEALLRLVGNLRRHLLDLRTVVSDSQPQPIAADEGTKPTIYLHGRDDAPEYWESAADALESAGFPVTPDGPEPVEPDAEKRARIRESRVGAMSACDALLVVGPQDSAIFSEEVSILGKDDRGLAIDRAERVLGRRGKKLPCAVIDTVTDPARARRRKAWAENNRLGWFELADPAWVNRASEWLGAAMR
jgi:hypothetical protein